MTGASHLRAVPKHVTNVLKSVNNQDIARDGYIQSGKRTAADPPQWEQGNTDAAGNDAQSNEQPIIFGREPAIVLS
jgi:hypothetical protein